MTYPTGFGDTDLETFFADFSVAVYTATSVLVGNVIMDEATEAHDFKSQHSEVQVGLRSFLIISHLLTDNGLTVNERIQLDTLGSWFRISKIDKEADGRTSRVFIRKAEAP